VLSVPAGASFTEVTLKVKVFGEASRFRTAVGSSTIVFNLKGETCVRLPLPLSTGVKWRLGMLASGMKIACNYRSAAQCQGASSGQSGDQHTVEGIGGAIIGIGEAEVAGSEGMSRIF